MKEHVKFFVEGNPKPKGSMRGFVHGKRVVLTNNDPKTKPWQTIVATIARGAMRDRELLTGPVGVFLKFVMARPKNQLGKDGKIKESAPVHHTNRPDIDKLARLVNDALTGIVFRDDCLIVFMNTTKRYTGIGCPCAGVHIEVSAL